MKPGESLAETFVTVHRGPDEQGRYFYTLEWFADYHPGHPDGEYAHRKRGQCFFAALPKYFDDLPKDNVKDERGLRK